MSARDWRSGTARPPAGSGSSGSSSRPMLNASLTSGGLSRIERLAAEPYIAAVAAGAAERGGPRGSRPAPRRSRPTSRKPARSGPTARRGRTRRRSRRRGRHRRAPLPPRGPLQVSLHQCCDVDDRNAVHGFYSRCGPPLAGQYPCPRDEGPPAAAIRRPTRRVDPVMAVRARKVKYLFVTAARV